MEMMTVGEETTGLCLDNHSMITDNEYTHAYIHIYEYTKLRRKIPTPTGADLNVFFITLSF